MELGFRAPMPEGGRVPAVATFAPGPVAGSLRVGSRCLTWDLDKEKGGRGDEIGLG